MSVSGRLNPLLRLVSLSRKHPGLTFFLALAAMTVLFTQVIILPPAWVEAVYTRGVYPWLDRFLGGIADLFPLSLTEFGFIAVTAGAISMLARRVRRKRSWPSLVGRVILFMCALYIGFYLAWGLNYYRQPLVEQLELAQGAVPPEIYEAIARDFARQTDSLRPALVFRETDAIEADIDRTYPKVLQELGLASTPPASRLKRLILFNDVLNYTQTSGFFSPFFHEVHVNAELLPPELPFVMAHERAHQYGYASEAEASFLAHLVCVRARLPVTRYSGYFRVIGRVLAAIPDADIRRSIWNSLRPEVRDDFAAVRSRISRYEGPLARLSQRGYDFYLRGNRIPEGVRNYGRVVDLLALYYGRRDRLSTDPGR